MSPPETKEWWERVRGKNRSLKGFISARRRFSARMERMSGNQPVKRQFSVPEIARRIGVTLAGLKRIIRGQDEAPLALLVKLARDLDMPLKELKAVAEESRAQVGSGKGAGSLLEVGGDADPLQVLEEGLISSARAFVQLLRNCTERSGSRGR